MSPPIKQYVDLISDNSTSILIPGAGNGYEAEYLHRRGFSSIHVLDIVQSPLNAFQSRIPGFPSNHLHCGDFFQHQGAYDLILEQTFFCAIDPHLRTDYVKKVRELLKPGGKLAGLLWNVPMNEHEPPFGGSAAEYIRLFKNDFEILTMQPALNSIAPRQGREIFIEIMRPMT